MTDKHTPRFAHTFYKSYAWMQCARAYREKVGGLCERCLADGLYTPSEEVHHKKHLTPDNINDPSIALNHDNLIALCKPCHIKEHQAKRWRADDMGHVEI